jgi:hypothetical protein
VRRDYIRNLLARRQPPKGMLRGVTEQIMRRPERVGDGKDNILAELTGTNTATWSWDRHVGPELTAEAPTSASRSSSSPRSPPTSTPTARRGSRA